MTRKRASAPVAPSYVPNARLVETYGSRFDWKAKSLATVLSAFGPLSDAAIRRLFERIIDEARSIERHAMSDEKDRHRE